MSLAIVAASRLINHIVISSQLLITDHVRLPEGGG